MAASTFSKILDRTRRLSNEGLREHLQLLSVLVAAIAVDAIVPEVNDLEQEIPVGREIQHPYSQRDPIEHVDLREVVVQDGTQMLADFAMNQAGVLDISASVNFSFFRSASSSTRRCTASASAKTAVRRVSPR
jgi:hypothetical protein